MENRTYLVTEAEKLTGEKAHVLRYWEDELGMEIHRNSLGHRCYTAQDIQIFLGIRELKKKGLHLKAIRELMPKLVQATAEIKAFPAEAAETAKEKPDPAIPGKADEVPEVVVDLLPEREAEQLADTVMRQEEEERQTEFYRVLGRLLDQMIQKRRQEERSRRVDEAIRRHQQSRREAAATLEQKGNGRKQNGAIGTMGKSDRKKNACERRSFGSTRKSDLFCSQIIVDLVFQNLSVQAVNHSCFFQRFHL